MLIIIAFVATVFMIIKDYKKFYVYLLMFTGVFLYWLLAYGRMYGIDVPQVVSPIASLIPVAVLFIAILSRRNKDAQ